MTTPSQSAPQEVPQWAFYAVHEIETMTRLWVEKDEEDRAAAIITKHAAALSEENERLKREVENWKGACLEADKTKCELRATVDYLQNYVIPEKDKHGKYWHDLAQERLADRSTMETRHGEVLTQLTTLRLWSEQAREELRKIRNSAGEQVMVCTAEGHSECVHRANAVLAAHPAQGMEGRG